MLWHKQPSSSYLLCPSFSPEAGNKKLWPPELCGWVCICVCVFVEQAIKQEPRPATSTPAITSTVLFLPVGWFLPLRSLHFLHTHISLQQQYLFLNLAQVLWIPWTSNNSSSISLSLCFHVSMHSPAFPLTCFLCLNSHLKGTRNWEYFNTSSFIMFPQVTHSWLPGPLRIYSQHTYA